VQEDTGFITSKKAFFSEFYIKLLLIYKLSDKKRIAWRYLIIFQSDELDSESK